jgi:FkbM family methyltransferase
MNKELALKVSPVAVEGGDIYQVRAGKESIWIAERIRANRYAKGVKSRCDALARYYTADRIKDWSGKLVIDAGANVGEFSMYAHARGAKVIACELEPLTFECLRRNMAGTDVVCLNVGLWNEDGEVPFYFRPWASSTLLSNEPTDRTAQAMTLRSLINERGIRDVAFIKADVEGTEPELLQGAVGVFDRIRCLALACGPERLDDQCTDEACIKILIEAGYHVTLGNTNRRVVWAEWLKSINGGKE